MATNHQTETLYDSDYFLWLEKTASLLKKGDLTELDLPNLIEEIEGIGQSQREALESNLRVVLMHLLKYKYQPNKRSSSWLSSIREHRIRLNKTFKHSPSLKRYFAEVFDECYSDPTALASDETGLPQHTFTEHYPFTPEQALDTDYLP